MPKRSAEAISCACLFKISFSSQRLHYRTHNFPLLRCLMFTNQANPQVLYYSLQLFIFIIIHWRSIYSMNRSRSSKEMRSTWHAFQSRMSNLASKLGQIGPKWDKSNCPNNILVHCSSPSYTISNWSQKVRNLSHLEPNLASNANK